MHGREKLLRVPKWSDSSCMTVVFPPYRFYPEKEVHVQITLNHLNLNDSVTVHHAITSWTENVNTKNFTVCAMQSGRNGNNFNPLATLDWMAYQGAPLEGMTGIIKIQKWWSGTNCADVTFPKVALIYRGRRYTLVRFQSAKFLQVVFDCFSLVQIQKVIQIHLVSAGVFSFL